MPLKKEFLSRIGCHFPDFQVSDPVFVFKSAQQSDAWLIPDIRFIKEFISAIFGMRIVQDSMKHFVCKTEKNKVSP